MLALFCIQGLYGYKHIVIPCPKCGRYHGVTARLVSCETIVRYCPCCHESFPMVGPGSSTIYRRLKENRYAHYAKEGETPWMLTEKKGG